MVDAIAGGERRLAIETIDRARRGVEQMADASLPAPLQHIQMTHQIGIGIGVWVVDGVAHPGLGSQVNDPLELLAGKQLGHGGPIGQIQLDEAEVGP